MIKLRAVSRARRRAVGLSVLVVWALFAPTAGAQTSDDGVAQTPVLQAPSVLAAWLAFPSIGDAEWRYAYMRADATAEVQTTRRRDLFTEFDELGARLESYGYSEYAATVETWRERLAAMTRFREPGDWSPAWLMAHPNRQPPVARVAAIGHCQTPDWIELWDRAGVRRVPWRSGMRLSDIVSGSGPLGRRGIDVVSVVSPEGDIGRYGVASWNEGDTTLSPGSRVVAPLPLGGDAFAWIRDTIARFLSRVPAGQQCREVSVVSAGGQS